MDGLVLSPDQFKAVQSTLKALGFQRIYVDAPGSEPLICPNCDGNCMIYISYKQQTTKHTIYREYHFCIDCWHAVEDFTSLHPERHKM